MLCETKNKPTHTLVNGSMHTLSLAMSGSERWTCHRVSFSDMLQMMANDASFENSVGHSIYS